MNVGQLRKALIEIPDDAQVCIYNEDERDWGIEMITFDPIPQVVPGTSGKVRKPTLRMHVWS